MPSPEKEGCEVTGGRGCGKLGTAARRIAAPRRGSAMPANDLIQGNEFTTDR